jgi:hypothetical protein
MPAAGQVPDDGSGEVRVLHWNIHSWRDESGAPNTGAVIELISRTKPHAVSLVEVDETWSAPMVLPPCCSSSLALFATGYVAMTRHITNAGAFYKAHMFARTCVRWCRKLHGFELPGARALGHSAVDSPGTAERISGLPVRRVFRIIAE